jgi:biotin carboxylase
MTVFILGAGIMQIPAIRAAQELGWFAAAADANALAPGASVADRFVHVDLKDLDGLLAAARGLREERGLDAVFTAGTDFSAAVAWLAERLDLPGIPYDAALRASDKLRMRAAFEAAGLASPRFTAVEAGADPAAAIAAAGLDLPLVVKPADSMGARGCRLVRSPAELDDACARALGHSRSARAIVEEYMDGPEFSLDALVADGEVMIRGFADRHIRFSPYFIEVGHTMPTAFPRDICDEVARVFTAGVRALGITRGAAKGDMKWSAARECAMIGEIAARLSGGYMSGWTYPYASGIDVTKGALELAAGRAPAVSVADRGWVSAERAFISIPGRVSRLVGLRDAESLPFIKNLFTRVAPGDDCVFPSNNVEKCGNVIAQAPDRETAIAAAEAAIRGIIVRLEAGREETEAFLRGTAACGTVVSGNASGGDGLSLIRNPDGTTWPPEAFDLPPRLCAVIDALPDAFVIADDDQDLDGGPLVLALSPECGLDGWGGQDWSGRGFAESAELALRLAGGRFVDHERSGKGPAGASREKGGGRRVLAARFWKALARGGAQAALYVLDTADQGGGPT